MKPTRARRRTHPHAGWAASAGAGFALVTVSDTRTAENDPGGDRMQRVLEGAGHRLVRRDWVPDQIRRIRSCARAALGDGRVDVVLATGGTGLAPRDVTPEALAPLAERILPGFGELFRLLSHAEIGSAAWLSRAGAGVARGRLLFWLPGSPAGAELAVRTLILPELGHALKLLGRTRE